MAFCRATDSAFAVNRTIFRPLRWPAGGRGPPHMPPHAATHRHTLRCSSDGSACGSAAVSSPRACPAPNVRVSTRARPPQFEMRDAAAHIPTRDRTAPSASHPPWRPHPWPGCMGHRSVMLTAAKHACLNRSPRQARLLACMSLAHHEATGRRTTHTRRIWGARFCHLLRIPRASLSSHSCPMETAYRGAPSTYRGGPSAAATARISYSPPGGSGGASS